MSEPPQRAAHSGTGYAGTGFRGIGGDLLRTFPPLAPPPPDPPAIDLVLSACFVVRSTTEPVEARQDEPTAPAFAVYGAHILGPIVSDPGGFRVSPCPVCRTRAILPHAGGWIPIRCPDCGTEFVATDGSRPPPTPPPPRKAPPPPPPPPRAWSGPRVVPPPVARVAADGSGFVPCPRCRAVRVSVPKSSSPAATLRCPGCRKSFVVSLAKVGKDSPPDAELLRRNLERWVASGEPDRWVAYREGVWNETDFAALLESLRFTAFWPLDPAAVRAALTEASECYRAAALPRTAYVFERYGHRYTRCPVCAMPLLLPPGATGEVLMTCPPCGVQFVVEVPPAPPPSPVPPPPPPDRLRSPLWSRSPGNFWGIVGAWVAILLIVGPFLLTASSCFGVRR